ncbi:hypothetical protein K3172_09165 [Qipengyuania sp. 6B39]|uniref:hypothetical protein n=1 Tax=Qipengyuania proteolytica TaxID=2867239 RepID=UPI001C8A7A78|nr:hypothetical protein [Qipengyuania proteolytica]MBX7496020.1 hypothetical protein [Qipengyuania proteolytica]
MVLSRGDDFPIHQTPEPVAYAGTDRNFYDRYFFNGYALDGSGFFAVALGIYPHLDVVDAHFSVIRDGVQHCIHASAELGMERMVMRAGPIAVEVVEPLDKLRVVVDDFEGISADLAFIGRSFPIEEPRFTHRIGPRAFMDYTRMTQNGRYQGWIEVDGDRRELAEGTMGTRDRSWGVRPVGTRDLQPMPGHTLPGFFWQWTPINFTNGSLFFHVNNDEHGEAWNTRAAWAQEGATASDLTEGHGSMRTRLAAGTRWPSGGTLSLALRGAPEQVTFEPLGRFQMRGLGYTHPDWNHGLYHGLLKVVREDIALEGLDPLAPENLHVQIPVRVRGSGGEEGIGVFEQLIIGPFSPLGLSEFLDGAD